MKIWVDRKLVFSVLRPKITKMLIKHLFNENADID